MRKKRLTSDNFLQRQKTIKMTVSELIVENKEQRTAEKLLK